MTLKENTSAQNPEEGKEDKRKKALIAVGVVLALIVIGVAAWVTYRQNGDDDGENSEGKTAETITQENTPTAQPGDGQATTATKTLPNGDTDTYLKAPPHIDGIPDDVEVDRGLAEHDPNDPIPADPREGIKPTLTVPTTARVSGGEGPDLTDPAVGSAEFLAKSFFNSAFSLCVKSDTSYNKNMRENYAALVTPDFKKRGISWGDENHSLDWKAYENPRGCNQLISFPSINGSSVGGGNVMYYDVTVNQRVTFRNGRGGAISDDLPPFRGNVKMVYLNGKWLVDDFQVNGGKMPTVR